jgi:hypothetical protein
MSTKRSLHSYLLAKEEKEFYIFISELITEMIILISDTIYLKLDHSQVTNTKFQRLLKTLNPLNAELNPICHLLILLGDLTFMGPCIVSIFQYISKKMQRYTFYLYLETALHVLGGTFTHHQERI